MLRYRVDTSAQTPESNADIVAYKLVYRAVVDDINDPGNAIALLFESMAAISRDIGGDQRAAIADWNSVVPDLHGVEFSEMQPVELPQVPPLVNRQALAMAEAWAKRWMLMHMAKHLCEELERVCMESPAASAIESIEYDESGRKVESWKGRT